MWNNCGYNFLSNLQCNALLYVSILSLVLESTFSGISASYGGSPKKERKKKQNKTGNLVINIENNRVSVLS